ncbi:hypothetical protein DFH06DRAFT_1172468 [Mycena polygramma]|nr:hypothetical protein DFH06DRAFT_1172468 [Mycena polygramma]
MWVGGAGGTRLLGWAVATATGAATAIAAATGAAGMRTYVATMKASGKRRRWSGRSSIGRASEGVILEAADMQAQAQTERSCFALGDSAARSVHSSISATEPCWSSGAAGQRRRQLETRKSI